MVGIKNKPVRVQLYKSLFFSVTRYCSGNWSQCATDYSYEDIQFLNMQFSKYGKYHFEEMLQTIYQLRIDKLLPSILESISVCFDAARADPNQFKKAIEHQCCILQSIICKAFIYFSDEIKRDRQLTQAYKNVLEVLVDLNCEDAAVLLDEFRLHRQNMV